VATQIHRISTPSAYGCRSHRNGKHCECVSPVDQYRQKTKIISQRVGPTNATTQGRGPLTLRGPGVRGSQPIPHHTSCSRTPSVRTPPPGLWQISDPRPFANTATSTSDGLAPCTTTELPRPRRRPVLQRQISDVVQAPIGSERPRRSSMSDELLAIATTRMLPEKPTLALNSEERVTAWAPMTFLSVLFENKRRNPHAPLMVSRFNPLRVKIPARAWISIDKPLISQRFKTPLSSGRSRT
jgi:hypothetical protein